MPETKTKDVQAFLDTIRDFTSIADDFHRGNNPEQAVKALTAIIANAQYARDLIDHARGYPLRKREA